MSKFESVEFKIPCGDWVFPSRDTTTPAPYPIDYPLVAEIFIPKNHKVSDEPDIFRHLYGPRFLHLNLLSENALLIDSLGNTFEDFFSLG